MNISQKVILSFCLLVLVPMLWICRPPAGYTKKPNIKISGTILRVNSSGFQVPAYVVVKTAKGNLSIVVDTINEFYPGEKGVFEYDPEANPKVLLSFVEQQ